jgi:hypothetical protein
MNEKLLAAVREAIRLEFARHDYDCLAPWEDAAAKAAIAAHSAFIREAAGRDDAQYSRSCVHHTLGGRRYVGVLDHKDGDAIIALVPFREDCPPLNQPDVDLILDALNRNAMFDQIERTPDAA